MNPGTENVPETLCSMLFASRARSVELGAARQNKESGDVEKGEKLKAKLEKAKTETEKAKKEAAVNLTELDGRCTALEASLAGERDLRARERDRADEAERSLLKARDELSEHGRVAKTRDRVGEKAAAEKVALERDVKALKKELKAAEDRARLAEERASGSLSPGGSSDRGGGPGGKKKEQYIATLSQPRGNYVVATGITTQHKFMKKGAGLGGTLRDMPPGLTFPAEPGTATAGGPVPAGSKFGSLPRPEKTAVAAGTKPKGNVRDLFEIPSVGKDVHDAVSVGPGGTIRSKSVPKQRSFEGL